MILFITTAGIQIGHESLQNRSVCSTGLRRDKLRFTPTAIASTVANTSIIRDTLLLPLTILLQYLKET